MHDCAGRPFNETRRCCIAWNCAPWVALLGKWLAVSPKGKQRTNVRCRYLLCAGPEALVAPGRVLRRGQVRAPAG